MAKIVRITLKLGDNVLFCTLKNIRTIEINHDRKTTLDKAFYKLCNR